MKFISSKKKEQQLRLIQRRTIRKAIRKAILHKNLVRLPKEYRGIIRIQCPSSLSLTSNFKNTIKFFRRIKTLAKHIEARQRYRKTTSTPFSIMMNDVDTITVRCAVMFSAELERLGIVARNNMIYTGKLENDGEAIGLVRQMGGFALLGIDTEVGKAQMEDGHRTAMELMSGKKLDEGRFDAFEESLHKLCETFVPLKVISGAIGEAMLNVLDHAYLRKIKLEFPSPGKRWWAAASHNPNFNELKILIYDQGHGIVNTLPKTGVLEKLTHYIDGARSGNVNLSNIGDHLLLKAVMERALAKGSLEPAKTRTNIQGRGKGFGDILKPIEKVPNCRLRVASGKAEVTYSLEGGIDAKTLPSHLGGTLIEWSFTV